MSAVSASRTTARAPRCQVGVRAWVGWSTGLPSGNGLVYPKRASDGAADRRKLRAES